MPDIAFVIGFGLFSLAVVGQLLWVMSEGDRRAGDHAVVAIGKSVGFIVFALAMLLAIGFGVIVVLTSAAGIHN